MSLDITVRIVGQAGQGMQSIGFIIGKIFSRHGYYVFTNQDVESRIRGGHSFVQVRVKDAPVHAVGENVDLMIVRRALSNPIVLITFHFLWKNWPRKQGKAKS